MNWSAEKDIDYYLQGRITHDQVIQSALNDLARQWHALNLALAQLLCRSAVTRKDPEEVFSEFDGLTLVAKVEASLSPITVNPAAPEILKMARFAFHEYERVFDAMTQADTKWAYPIVELTRLLAFATTHVQTL